MKIQRQHRAEGHLIVGGEHRAERFAADEEGLDGRLASQATALWAIMGAFVWRWAGFNTVIYLAGLQSISREYHEAAMIEGAGGGRRFLHISWPLLLPYTYTVVLLTTMGTLRIFDMMWIMTQGGPVHATETVATYIFTTAFRFQRAGYAQSLAFILLALVALLTLLLTVTLRKHANANEISG